MATKQQSLRTEPQGERQGQPARPSAPPMRPRDETQRRLKGVDDKGLARGLGWFSLGLGLAEVMAPQSVAKLIGARGDHRGLLRALGMREIASGVGILTQRRPAGWLLARAGGDAMDLALLGSALKSDQARRPRVTAAAAAVVGIMALDLGCGEQLRRSPGATQKSLPMDRSIRAEKCITVNRSPEELYTFWRRFENLPRFMTHLIAVRVLEEGRSHWEVKAPAGMTVEWDAEIIADRPNELIAWRSLEGADVDNAGSVRFKPAPGGKGTEVSVEMQYIPPAGVIGATFAKLFGEAPEQQMQEDLRRFKQVMEVGEVVQSEATARHRGPAQPSHAPVRS